MLVCSVLSGWQDAPNIVQAPQSAMIPPFFLAFSRDFLYFFCRINLLGRHCRLASDESSLTPQCLL
jgi:hypothetical protein